MHRQPGFPVANCNIKMPDAVPVAEKLNEVRDESEHLQKRQQLINFGHVQWGFNNWSWSVTKQELDFVDYTNCKYSAGVVAFVSVTVKTFDIHRENIGYATSIAATKGQAVYQARKCAVTNALRETLLSFGGTVSTELIDMLDLHKNEFNIAASAVLLEPHQENNQNVTNKLSEPKNSPINKNLRKDSSDSNGSNPAANQASNMRTCHQVAPAAQPVPKNAVVANPPPPPPVAKAPPLPANMAPVNRPPVLPANAPRPPPPPPQVRPNSNEALKPLHEMTDEEARAERKRRQRLAQEEFRQKQMLKQKGLDDKQELQKTSNSIDSLLMGIPSQDIKVEETPGNGVGVEYEIGKRRSPTMEDHGGHSSKRRNLNELK